MATPVIDVNEFRKLIECKRMEQITTDSDVIVRLVYANVEKFYSTVVGRYHSYALNTSPLGLWTMILFPNMETFLKSRQLPCENINYTGSDCLLELLIGVTHDVYLHTVRYFAALINKNLLDFNRSDMDSYLSFMNDVNGFKPHILKVAMDWYKTRCNHLCYEKFYLRNGDKKIRVVFTLESEEIPYIAP